MQQDPTVPAAHIQAHEHRYLCLPVDGQASPGVCLQCLVTKLETGYGLNIQCNKNEEGHLELYQNSNTCPTQTLISLNLPTLQYRRERSDIIQTFQILNGLDTLNQNTSALFAHQRCSSTVSQTEPGDTNSSYSTKQPQDLEQNFWKLESLNHGTNLAARQSCPSLYRVLYKYMSWFYFKICAML